MDDAEIVVKMYAKVCEDLCRRTAELAAAIEDIRALAADSEDICEYCKHHALAHLASHCLSDGRCKHYVEDIVEADGKRHDWQVTCQDLDFGACPLLKNTPCAGCAKGDLKSFEWRGLQQKEADAE